MTAKVVGAILLTLGCVQAQVQHFATLTQAARAVQADPALASIGVPQSGTVKCGTPFVVALRLRWNQLTPQSRAMLSGILQRPPLQKSRLSPSGRFRIHYDTTGSNQPALITGGQDVPNSYEAFVDSAARILDHVWTVEIDTLGYAPPLPDGSQGGGPEYDVYLYDLGPGEFGYTDWDPNDPGIIRNGGNTRYPTFMVIDKDFLTLRTPGIDGLEVTCAHEFHHAIQMGGYGMWTESDFYFNELTSSWMEDVVYTSVNDYYYDIVNYFHGFRDSQGFPLSFAYYNVGSYAGYERCIFDHFLAKRYGRDVIREIWTGIRTEPFIRSAQDVFARHGTDWGTEFALFTYWNFHTADRADTVQFYPEGNHYPRFEPNFTTDFAPTTNTSTIMSGAYPLSSGMYEFRIQQTSDTVTVAVANTDVNAVLAGDNTTRQVELDLTKGILSIPHVTLANGYNAGIATSEPDKWRTFYLLSSTPSDIAKLQLQPSPNPYEISKASQLLLPLSGVTDTKADVYFLSSALTAQFSGRFEVKNFFGNQFIVVPSSAIRSRLSTGIYFVVAKTATSENTWKVAIIR